MAAPATAPPQAARDRKAILADAYPHVQNIAYARWKPHIDRAEIDALINNAVVELLDRAVRGQVEIIDVPRTTKYLANYIDWRATDYRRLQHRRPAEARLPDEDEPVAGDEALTSNQPTPEQALESDHVRHLVDELQARIPSRVNRLIIHLAYFDQLKCPEIADSVRRILGVELTAKAVERRKAETTKNLTVEWGRALSGAHCRELRAVAPGVEDSALTRYAHGLLDLDDKGDKHLHEIVDAHLQHCASCQAATAGARREMRQLALLAAPILVGVSDQGTHTAEHALPHAPGVFERALETMRSGIGRGSIRVAETMPNDGGRAGEMVGSAGAGGAAAAGSGLAAKLLIAGTTVVCAIGGQQLCVELFASRPVPTAQPHIVALRPKFPHPHSTTPAVSAAQVQPRAGTTTAQQIAHPAHIAALHRALRRANARSSSTTSSGSASTPASSSSSSPPARAASSTGSDDPTFSPTEPATSRSSSGGSGGSSGGGSTAGSSVGSSSSGSSSDPTFQGLP